MNQHATRVNDTTIRVPVSLLKPGMFVCRLDRPWLGTPFLMQGFLIQTNAEIGTLTDLCNQVYVDTQKSLISLQSQKRKRFSRRPIDDHFQYTPAIDREIAKTGLKSVLPVYSQTVKTLRSCFQEYAKNQLISAPILEQQIDHCLNAVLLNGPAMAWLSRVKSHSQYTSEHSMHVSMLAMVFAVHCGWSKEEARNAGLAGLLFDLGKLRIPQQILNKPGPLSESEWELFHDHPKWGRYYLEKSGFNHSVVEAAYYHHERPDGTGYPAKRVGSQTPILARLIRILDSFDAITSYRSYAQEKTIFEATKLLYRGRGTSYDQHLVDQFIAMIGVYPVGTIVELSTGEIAVVIGQNNDRKLLPKVSVVRDKNKNPTREKLVNLKDIVDENGQARIAIKSMLNDGSFGLYMKDYTKQLLIS